MSYIDKFDLLNRADSVYAFGFGEERARAWEREKERMHAAAVAFGEARGWKLSRRSFGIASLLRKGKDDPYLPCWWDHPYYYKVGRRPVAVVSHPYKCSVTFEDGPIGTPGVCTELSPYGEAALRSAAEKILTAPNGEQEATLNGEAYSIGRLAGAGGVPVELAVEVLLAAGLGMPSHIASKRNEAA